MKSLRLLPLVLLESVSACAPRPTVAARSLPADRAFVTPALAAALDRNGRFVLPEPSYRGASPARADSIARAAIAFQAEFARPGGESAISPADSAAGSLVPCGRRYYVLPVVDRLPADLPRHYALPYTARWLIPFCRADGTSPVSVEVADATPVLTIANGRLVGDFSSEGEYGVLASGQNEDGYVPLSPEQAARFAAAATGVRIAEVPVALTTHPGSLGNVAPAKCMRWRIILEKPVRFAGQYGEYETAEVYVRLSSYCFGAPVLQVVDRQQKPGGWIEYPRFGANRAIASLQRVNVVFARPLQFDIVHRVP
jgi:hypothetical protein